MSEPRWRKSSTSDSGSSCVEIRHDLAGIRDSKCPDGPALSIPVAGLLGTVKAGHLDG